MVPWRSDSCGQSYGIQRRGKKLLARSAENLAPKGHLGHRRGGGNSPMDSPSKNPGYEGTERRRHRVYMTRNTEYHFRDGVCVAVRDRRTGDWLPGHLAL